MPIQWTQLKSLIDTHQAFLLTSHVRPDCDALGSELGMAELLRSMGKEVRILNADPTPPHLAFIDPDEQIQSLAGDHQPPDLARFDVMVVLDTSAWNQLGEMGDLLRHADQPIVGELGAASHRRSDRAARCKGVHVDRDSQVDA